MLEDDSSDDINDEEGENNEQLFTDSYELSFGGFGLCFLFVYILRRKQNYTLLYTEVYLFTFW